MDNVVESYSATDRSAIIAEDVHKCYGSIEVLKGISFTVKHQTVVALLGRSGGGKSTLLRCINHLERIDRGRIFVYDRPVGYRIGPDGTWRESHPKEILEARRQIGMVAQQFQLFEHLTALDNVTIGLRVVKGVNPSEAEQVGLQHLNKVGLADKATAYPQQLSGGQQQRVAIARALAMAPQLMLFDEPTSALDPQLVGEVLDVMRTLANEGMTMVVATHEIEFAKEASDWVIFMDDGRVIEQGPASIVLSEPVMPRTKEFLARHLRESQ